MASRLNVEASACLCECFPLKSSGQFGWREFSRHFSASVSPSRSQSQSRAAQYLFFIGLTDWLTALAVVVAAVCLLLLLGQTGKANKQSLKYPPIQSVVLHAPTSLEADPREEKEEFDLFTLGPSLAGRTRLIAI